LIFNETLVFRSDDGADGGGTLDAWVEETRRDPPGPFSVKVGENRHFRGGVISLLIRPTESILFQAED
jgi:hypothetical protein